MEEFNTFPAFITSDDEDGSPSELPPPLVPEDPHHHQPMFMLYEEERRQRALHQQRQELDQGFQLQQRQQQQVDEGVALVNNIASFLTVSDTASLMAASAMETDSYTGGMMNDDDENDSWAIGVELDTGSDWSLETPPTPAIVAISPGATPHVPGQYDDDDNAISSTSFAIQQKPSQQQKQQQSSSSHRDEDTDSEYLEEVLRERRRKWAQEKITAAVFAHPKPLRSYCVEAFNAAMMIRQQKEQQMNPETLREPPQRIVRKRKPPKNENTLRIIHELIDVFFSSLPLSVIMDLLEKCSGLALDTVLASFRIAITSLNKMVMALGRMLQAIWDTITNFNPFQLLEAIISLQFNAMGKTSEVLASGIQSVATGVGSASSMALYRLSAANISAPRMDSASSLGGTTSLNGRSSSDVINKKLLEKLSAINDAARVVSYREMEDDTGGLTKQAVSRARRMMHYTVPLRPFLATVTLSTPTDEKYGTESENYRCSSDNSSVSCSMFSTDDDSESISRDDSESPFICATPQSFPPTPRSKAACLAQRSQFSDDVVFIARDRLRIHDGLKSQDERTRERSQVLENERRLAVFACKDPSSGIELTCGRHIATKVGHMYYASTRSMIPVLRNCYVYFELTVLPYAMGSENPTNTMVTLSIGLSTEEMPPNTLVGAWQGSVGLCTTGQILMGGQWCSPADPLRSAYGAGGTVGCLVYLNDESAFETWDGVMIKAMVRFTVNGMLVSQPVSTLPMSGSPQNPSSPSGSNDRKSNTSDPIFAESATSKDSFTPAATLSLLVPATEDLYPTVTLQSAGTAVVCRFSSEDIAYNLRSSMGAPEGVAIYAVDGSVILNADD